MSITIKTSYVFYDPKKLKKILSIQFPLFTCDPVENSNITIEI